MKIIYCLVILNFIVFNVMGQEKRFRAFPLTTSLWAEKNISVSWDNPKPAHAAMRELVKEAITNTWQKNSSLQFTDWCPSTQKVGDIRISVAEVEPEAISLGTNLRHEPGGIKLNFTFRRYKRNCRHTPDFCIKAIAAHEFGHALGFAHEQNRRDCAFPNCHNKTQGDNGDYFLYSCDPQSIMNYCAPTWMNEGLLSDLDIKALKDLYGLPKSEIIAESIVSYVIPKNNTNRVPFINPRRLKFVQTSNYINKNRSRYYHVKLYLTGPDSELDKIEKVVYTLPKQFTQNNITIIARKDLFGLESEVSNDYRITAYIYYKDKTKISLSHLVKVDNNSEASSDYYKRKAK